MKKQFSSQGTLRKLATTLTSSCSVAYQLTLGECELPLNQFLGEMINIRHTGQINCIQCGRKTKKSFQQGHCFPCMQRLAECDFCIIHPHKCHYPQGTCPDNDWAHAHCSQKHIVYLANSSGLKVGITRDTQIPTRWMDQGASQALPLMRVANRYQSGAIEMIYKQFVADRTDWRKLLKSEATKINLLEQKQLLFSQVDPELQQLFAQAEFRTGDIQWLDDAKPIEINYPVLQHPERIVNLSLDKTPEINGLLQGIKGQYLILDGGVINIRKFSGYEVEFSNQ